MRQILQTLGKRPETLFDYPWMHLVRAQTNHRFQRKEI
jgi:hypothetical protein